MMSCQYTVLLVLFQGITNKINTNKDTSYCLSCHCQTMVLLSTFSRVRILCCIKNKCIDNGIHQLTDKVHLHHVGDSFT